MCNSNRFRNFKKIRSCVPIVSFVPIIMFCEVDSNNNSLFRFLRKSLLPLSSSLQLLLFLPFPEGHKNSSRALGEGKFEWWYSSIENWSCKKQSQKVQSFNFRINIRWWVGALKKCHTKIQIKILKGPDHKNHLNPLLLRLCVIIKMGN